MATLGDWIHASRPKTLGAAVAPVAIGSVIGWRLGGGGFGALLFACTLGACVALQVATNFFNDALDFVKGSDTAARLGPRRITASGAVSVRAVMAAGMGFLAVAALLSLPLFLARGWPIVAIGIPSLYFCFGYTGGPCPLAYRGLGELFVILFFGIVAVAGSAFVQSGTWHLEALVAGLQAGCLSTVLIAVNNLRDREEDALTGKRTLAVRFGARFARWEILALFTAGYALGLWWLSAGRAALAWVPLAGLPLAMVIVRGVFRQPPGRAFNSLLALSGVHLLFFALLFCISFR
jgi:1,4-dihydroxy-2-naphthoate octaprenyltransferase